MSSGPRNVTSTSTSEPPEYLRGILENLSGVIGGNLSQLNSPGAPAGPGDNLIGDSQDLLSRTIGGDFLSPDSNPHLMSLFNRGADTIGQRLNTQFGGAGRDLNAAAPGAKQEFSDLFANLFGGNFQQERNRQMGAIDQAQGLDPLNRIINQVAGVIPGAGGSTQSTQPVFRTGLF